MNAFDIVALVEAVVGQVNFSISGKVIRIFTALTDEQIDAAFAKIAKVIGLINYKPRCIELHVL